MTIENATKTTMATAKVAADSGVYNLFIIFFRDDERLFPSFSFWNFTKCILFIHTNKKHLLYFVFHFSFTLALLTTIGSLNFTDAESKQTTNVVTNEHAIDFDEALSRLGIKLNINK
jgi:hypothetical protein